MTRDEAIEAVSASTAQDAATGRLTPGTGGSEGPPVSGPENAYKCSECGDRECGGYECEVVERWTRGAAYKCAHCGRVLGSFEAGIARIGDSPVCHPNDDGPDCYRLVTVYGEKLGARR